MPKQTLPAETVQQINRLVQELLTYNPIGREEYEQGADYRSERIAALEKIGKPALPYLLPTLGQHKGIEELIVRLGGPAPADVAEFLSSADPALGETQAALIRYLIAHQDPYKGRAEVRTALTQLARRSVPAPDPAQLTPLLVQVLANKALATFGDLSVKDNLIPILDQILAWSKTEDLEGLLSLSNVKNLHLLYEHCTGALGLCQASEVLLEQLKKVDRYYRTYVINGLSKIRDPKLLPVYLELAERELKLGMSKIQTSFSPIIYAIEESAAPAKEKQKALQGLLPRTPPNNHRNIEQALQRLAKLKKGPFGLW